MITITALAKDVGDHIETHVVGDIESRGDLLVCEMANVLEEFHKVKNGEFLTMAIDMLIQKLEEDHD